MLHSKRKQAGDTIVEVVIAIAVVSTILVGAFVVTNRSTRAVRDSEEHAQALQYLQGQVELLRHSALVPGALLPPNLANLTTPFCLDVAGPHQPADTQNACLLNNLYRMKIWQDPASAGPTTTFILTATWPALDGSTGTVNLSYKVAVT